jgi:cathepsin B
MQLTLALLLAVIGAASADDKRPALTQEMINEINGMKTTWKAGFNTKFHNATVADVKMLLGTVMPGEAGYVEAPPHATAAKPLLKDTPIPESFDLREAQPQCASISGHVRDQSNCGSCWAFGSTEALNDRHCIATGDAKTLLSPEDTAACCRGAKCAFSMGCNGGQPSGAWSWFASAGVSSGGDYENVDDGSSCKPYSLHSCAHHSDPSPGQPPCEDLPTYETPKCTNTCSDSNYGGQYSTDKIMAKSHYSVKGIENMQRELMEKGTLSVALQVYEDFEAYTGGVYQHTTGKYLGGHAVKMIGWGVDNGTPYWLCVNSWNYGWGEQGLFRILRGSNECGIEGSVVAGDA